MHVPQEIFAGRVMAAQRIISKPPPDFFRELKVAKGHLLYDIIYIYISNMQTYVFYIILLQQICNKSISIPILQLTKIELIYRKISFSESSSKAQEWDSTSYPLSKGEKLSPLLMVIFLDLTAQSFISFQYRSHVGTHSPSPLTLKKLMVQLKLQVRILYQVMSE